jgi:hypothetical protein
MTVEVGGAGFLGVGLETTLGTFAAATKWIPFRSETMRLMEDKIWGTNIRGVADRSRATQGYTWVEGDITFEVTPDIMVYFFYASRNVPVKTGAGPFTYTFTPAHVAKASTASGASNRKTLSMIIQRSNNPMGYVGCSVGQLAFTVDNGLLMCTASIVGVDEATQTLGTPTYVQQEVVGPGDITLEVPTATVRSDADTFTATINDNLVRQNRLNGLRKAAYQNWGEREITLAYEIDFDTLTDYAAFKAQTIQAVTLKGVSVAATEEVTMVFNATAIDSFEANLSALGDVNRATVNMHAFYNTTNSMVTTIKTAETIT